MEVCMSALERFSITIAAATIVGILGKLASMYELNRRAGLDWLAGPVDQTILTSLSLAIFLLFFRAR